MRFLIIVVCLLSERFLIHNFHHYRQIWLNIYFDKIKRYVPPPVLFQKTITPYFVTLLSLIFFTLIVTLITKNGLLFILYFIFESIVFYFCLGEHNLFYTNTAQETKLNSKQYIQAINHEYFAVILWFFFFGPMGAILYRVTHYFSKLQPQESQISFILNILDWIPVRLSAFFFLLVGQFQPGFSHLIQKISSKPDYNHQLLNDCAKYALGHDKEHDPITLETLFTHSCILLNFLLAILMIGKIL
jgi:AmpE protein